ncbi:MAG: alpha/beta fold hydrolase [Gemmatimonadaceae bacterium]
MSPRRATTASIELDEFELWRDRGDDSPLIIRCEARTPPAPVGTVIVCHGFKGFARFSFFPYLAEMLAEAGCRAVTFDFSGSGIGDDRESFSNRDAFTRNTYLRELDDLAAVVGEARLRHWIDDGYGLFGHSRGGGIAILQASRDSGVKALATWAAISATNRWPPEMVAQWRERGFMDVANSRTGDVIPVNTDLLHEVENFGGTTLNIAFAASRVRRPWLIVHGAEDETVPLHEGERLARQSGGYGDLRVLEGVNHSFGGKHPLEEVTDTLESATRMTVDFFVEQFRSNAV